MKKILLQFILNMAIACQFAFFADSKIPGVACLSGMITGAYVCWHLTRPKNREQEAEIILGDHDQGLLVFTALQWINRGYKVVYKKTKRKYWLFGKAFYEVGLVRTPEHHTNSDDAFARAFHEAVFKGAQREPTDEELKQQERYEELAERQKKRNSKS
jgi:hypothetical protein